ncbi:MAG: NAD(P)/FAD-dependent oxidoreductase [Chitinophagaceae bacterium]
MPQHIVIIGNGISGITCARNIRKQSNDSITVISSETEHFYSRTALMYIYMGHMKYEHTKPYEDWFWQKNRIQLVKDHVTSIDIKNKKVVLQTGSQINYDKLVIATGSVSNKPNFTGINLKGVQSLYGMPDVVLMNENTKGIKKAAIIGGGLIGIEMAEMLLSRNIAVTFLIREDAYWNNILPKEEAELITRHIKEHHVDLRTATELKEIKGDGKVSSIITNKDEEIACEFVGVTVGVSPNIYIIANTEIETDRGVLVNDAFETNVPDVYAIGDCVQHRTPALGRKAVEQVWYTGKIHGETLASTLCGNRTAYNPGPWFNSAKFFDIEYQTYGIVNAQQKENENSFYWEHPNGRICFRAVYGKEDETIIGFNALGMRLRHAVCDKWLQEKRKIDDVMANLHLLNFDPEFNDKHEKNIISAYDQQSGKKINRNKKLMISLNW